MAAHPNGNNSPSIFPERNCQPQDVVGKKNWSPQLYTPEKELSYGKDKDKEKDGRIKLCSMIISELMTANNGELQAETRGLPPMVLREAIVNALMHPSNRVDRPRQIIRCDNRIEIINAVYSLKDEKTLKVRKED